MPRGGARVNSGPPPDPNALRRDRPSDKDGWTELPAEGRRGRAPKFPLIAYTPRPDDDQEVDPAAAAKVAKREAELWRAAWQTPQAVMWERFGWTHEVALYVRLMVLAETGDVKAMSEVRQWSDRLGLNPAAMLRNRWRVVADQVAARRTATRTPAAQPAGGSVRDRLKALDGGGA